MKQTVFEEDKITKQLPKSIEINDLFAKKVNYRSLSECDCHNESSDCGSNDNLCGGHGYDGFGLPW